MENVAPLQTEKGPRPWGGQHTVAGGPQPEATADPAEAIPPARHGGAPDQISRKLPQPLALLELTKPITWFPPVWAYACGLVASGMTLTQIIDQRGVLVLLGLILAGPAVCGTSQIINDWFDRKVDAINEPARPIPSGRVPGQWGLYWALCWIALSVGLALLIGGFAVPAALFGLVCAWVYSAPPFRFKRSGWLGPATVAVCYEGLPWLTATAIVLAQSPGVTVWAVAILYSVGAHGIMTLNDFKAVEGDRQTGVKSLPVTLGIRRASMWSAGIMAVAQLGVVTVLAGEGLVWAPALITISLICQIPLMRKLFKNPARLAPWYSMWGVGLYVLGMMVCALALGGYLS